MTTTEQNMPKLRFPEFSGEWVERRLGEVATITTGSTPPTSQPEFYGGDRLFVSPADLESSRYLTKTRTRLSPLGFAKGRKIDRGSVLFVCIGSTIGKIGQCATECVTNQQINALKGKNTFENDFIYTQLEKNASRIRRLAGTQAVPQINKTDFSRFRFNFPEHVEQQKIAAFLSAVDKKIEQLGQKKSWLTQYKKGMMQKLFSREIRFKDAQGNDYSDWEEKRLGLLGRFTGGGTPDTSTLDYWNGNIAWVSSSDIVEDNIHKLEIKHRISEEAIDASATQLTPKGAVLIVTRVGVGKCAIAPVDVCTSQDFTNFVPNSGVIAFFAYWLSHYKNRLQSLAQGTSIKGITTRDLKGLKIEIPELEEQQKIADFLSAIDQKIQLVSSELEKAQAFKKGLLQQMFV